MRIRLDDLSLQGGRELGGLGHALCQTQVIR
jgi:hypothetical protein